MDFHEVLCKDIVSFCQWAMKVQLDSTMIYAWFDSHASRKRRGYRGVCESITSPRKSIINGGWTEGNVWIYRLLCNSTILWMHSKRTWLDALSQHWKPEWKKRNKKQSKCLIGICASASPNASLVLQLLNNGVRSGKLPSRKWPYYFLHCTLRLLWISRIYLCQTALSLLFPILPLHFHHCHPHKQTQTQL